MKNKKKSCHETHCSPADAGQNVAKDVHQSKTSKTRGTNDVVDSLKDGLKPRSKKRKSTTTDSTVSIEVKETAPESGTATDKETAKRARHTKRQHLLMLESVAENGSVIDKHVSADSCEKAKKMRKARHDKKKKHKKLVDGSEVKSGGSCEGGKSGGGNLVRDCALEYLRKWKHDQDSWSFQKVRQVWLLQHMYDVTQVGEKDFELLLEYLEKLTGKARQATIDTAEKMLNESEEAEETKSIADVDEAKAQLSEAQMDRIRQVLQMLS